LLTTLQWRRRQVLNSANGSTSETRCRRRGAQRQQPIRLVSDADKSLHLCNNLGAKVFGELRLRTAPTRSADVDYKVLTDMLRERYGSTHSEIREHQVFQTVRQGAGQSIREYSAALRNQAGKCSFADVDVQLRDQFTMGLARDELRQKILAEPHTTARPLTYDTTEC
jgi:hypothetical protein